MVYEDHYMYVSMSSKIYYLFEIYNFTTPALSALQVLFLFYNRNEKAMIVGPLRIAYVHDVRKL